MATIDTGVLNALLTQVASAAQAAADAAKTAGEAKPREGPDWSKLLTKPSCFDHKSQEEEIKHFKDWSWQVVQYVSAIDSAFSKDMEDLAEHPETPMDMSTANAATRERSNKLYGLLAGLLKGRALQTLRAVGNSNGYEAWRQLLLTLRPTNKNRGLALLSAVMGWPSFQMGQAIQPQLLKLEDAFEEARRASVTLQDEIKVAVVLRCISGQLRTHVSLQLNEGMSYAELRECLMKWDRAQQKWSHLVNTQEAVAMEIDRIEGKGDKGKSKGKGKGKYDKGKGKGKKGDRFEKGKGKGKWKGGAFSEKGKGGWSQDKGAGKSKGKDQRVCWKCGAEGHFARDCVRQVSEVPQVQQLPQAPVPSGQSGSGTSAISGITSFSSATLPTRVARITRTECYAEQPVPSTFDLRDLSSGFSSEESIRVVKEFYIGDESEIDEGEVRMVAEIDSDFENEEKTAIIIDSGADAPIFPATWKRSGKQVVEKNKRSGLQDAQGKPIPTLGRRDIEVLLRDDQGKMVKIRERVTISEAVSQPILCFGRLMEQGWSINSREQALVHEAEGKEVKIPVEMQNRSLTVLGHIRMIEEKPLMVRMMSVTLDDSLRQLNHGWHLNDKGMEVGFHLSNHYQDPSLVSQDLVDRRRTTLIQHSSGLWDMVEYCEPLQTWSSATGEFEEPGMRYVITILTKDTVEPELMGFSMDEEIGDFDMEKRNEPNTIEEDKIPEAPDENIFAEDLSDRAQVPEAQGEGDPVQLQQPPGEVVQEGQQRPELAVQPVVRPRLDEIVVAPFDAQEIVVNGVTLDASSSQAALKAALRHYGKSTSGSKRKLFERLVNHMKQMELELAREAALQADRAHHREPRMQVAANRPSEKEVELHCLTHTPYQGWCEYCVAHRARPDRHERNDLSKESSIPTISFDFCYTKALGDGEAERDVNAAMWMVMADSHSGYLGCCSLKGKSQIKLATHELMAFTQSLGYTTVCFSSDNEPTTRMILRGLLNARHALGLPTRISTSKIADHSNALAENAVNRIRGLACTLMEEVQQKIMVKLSTDNPLWSWASRHSAWIMNRYRAVRGATPYELIYGKPYRGVLAKFGEPVFSYLKTHLKGEKKWHKSLFLGKTEGQDSFVVYDGERILLTKSVRRIGQDWGLSLAFYKEFKCPTFDYQTGFGSRIIPTKRDAIALPAAEVLIPMDQIRAKAKDPEAEAVILKAIEESREEAEQSKMEKNDPKAVSFAEAPEEAVALGGQQQQLELQGDALGSTEDVSRDVDLQLQVDATRGNPPPSAPKTEPLNMQKKKESQTPRVLEVDDDTPLEALMNPGEVQIRLRSSSSTTGAKESMASSSRPSNTLTRGLEDQGDGHVDKKMKSESAKKQKISRLMENHEDMVRMIKIGDEEYYTIDEDEVIPEQWWSEDDALMDEEGSGDVPKELWRDFLGEEKPPSPDKWIDDLADEVELQRLLKMEVITMALEKDSGIKRMLTTKMVRDWRLKDYVEPSDGSSSKKWLRRSRLVAREYATTKRDYVFSPASSSHLLRLLPVIYLMRVGEIVESQQGKQDDVMIGSMDIKDAFLQVKQEEPLRIVVETGEFIVHKNLPGQRLGAKAWFDHISNFLKEKGDFKSCDLNPCLLRNDLAMLLIHVDDIMITGSSYYIEKVFVPMIKEKFETSLSFMKCEGDEISFLKRTYRRVSDGIVIIPGHYIETMLKVFEEAYGKVKVQKIPADNLIQIEDESMPLGPEEATMFRSMVGMAIYLSQERLDIGFVTKELASKMSRPTKMAMGHLRKMLGYLKGTSNYAMKLNIPIPGKGSRLWSSKAMVLETYSDSDWSGNKVHRRSTSAGVHMLNGCTIYASSRTQKVVSLSSAEAELHSLVSSAADGIYMKGCLEFLLNATVDHVAYVDNAAARQLANKRGVGKIRHLSGKLLWVQNKTNDGSLSVVQVPTLVNVSDIETKPLTGARTRALLSMIGMVESESNRPVGENEYQDMMEKKDASSKVKGLSKALLGILAAGSMDGVQGFTENEVCYEEDSKEALVYKETFGLEHSWTLTFWSSMCIVLAIIAVIVGFAWAWVQVKLYVNKKLKEETDNLVARVASLEEANVNAVPWRTNIEAMARRMDTYTDVLWEGLVENGGCLLREREDMIRQTRWTELELIESSNLAAWRRRTADRFATPRGNREQPEDGREGEESSTYGAPASEEEPEPTHVHTEDEMTEPEGEDPLAGLTAENVQDMDAEDWLRRMQIVADHHEERLRHAEIMGDQEGMWSIQEQLDEVYLLMDQLPRP